MIEEAIAGKDVIITKGNYVKSPDLRRAEAALRRAAQRTKEKAHDLKVLIYKKEQSNPVHSTDRVKPDSHD